MKHEGAIKLVSAQRKDAWSTPMTRGERVKEDEDALSRVDI